MIITGSRSSIACQTANRHVQVQRPKNVRAPKDHMLGQRGGAFKVAQARLGGGRIHHAMRTVGQCNLAIEMMMERAVSQL